MARQQRKDRPRLVAVNFGEVTYRKAVVRPYEPKKKTKKKKGGSGGQAQREDA